MSGDAEQQVPRWARQVIRERDTGNSIRQLRKELTETQGRLTRLEQKARDEARFLQLQRAKEAREYQESELATEMGELVAEQEGTMEMPHGHVPAVDSGPPDQVVRQASSRADLWSEDFEHSPAFLDAIRDGASIAELRRRSADAMISESVRREPSPVMYQSRSWCGRGGCRPATPCPACAGHVQTVRDGSATGAPVQTSTHPGQSFWQRFPDHVSPGSSQPAPDAQGGGEWETTEPAAGDFMTARQHATMPTRAPSGDAEVLKGL